MTLNEFIGRATGFFDKAEKNLTSEETLAASKAEIEQLKLKVQENEAAASVAKASYEAVKAENAVFLKELADAKALAKTASEKVDIEIKRTDSTLSAMGVDPNTIPAQAPAKTDGVSANDKILAQYAAIKDPIQNVIFYRKNKEEIKAAMRQATQ